MGFASALTSGKALQSPGLRALFSLAPDEQAVCFRQPRHRDAEQVAAPAARAQPLRQLPGRRSMNQPIRMASLLSTPGVGFEQPFEMLEACHERVDAHAGAAAAAARAPARARRRCQRAPGRARCHALFRPGGAAASPRRGTARVPAAAGAGRSGDGGAGARACSRTMCRWSRAGAKARAGARCRGLGRAPGALAADEAALDSFAGLYDDHIQAEERLAYPAAAALLDAQALAAMGREMMPPARRGLSASLSGCAVALRAARAW